jgi:FAD binding domain
MTTQPATSGTRRPEPLDPADLDELRRSVGGRVYTSADREWDLVRMPWAAAIQQDPLAVVPVADADEVRNVIRWAVKHDRPVTAQPIGHAATGPLDGVVLLRTRALDAITIDAAASTATIGAGVKAGELLAALEGTGLTYLAGSNADPTVVAMTIGGGMSWFGRKYGLAANAVVSVDLVDGLGQARQVTAASDPDLFWALRGGGGDFGIITAMTIRLFPASSLYGGRLLWPIEQMPAVLRAFRDVTETAPEDLTVWYHTYQFPPLPELPEPIRGKAFASVAATFLGAEEEAERLLQPFRAVPGVVMDLMRPVPMHELGLVGEEPTDPLPTLDYSLLLNDLDDEAIERLTTIAGAGSGSPLMILQIRHLGGAFARREPEDGVASHIDQPYLMFTFGVPVAPEVAQGLAATFARLGSELDGHSDGTTVHSFLGISNDVSRVWPPKTRARLASIKRAVDPKSIIRSNRPVTPEAAPSATR